MRANEVEIYNLWLELIGDPSWKPLEDLEDKWIVLLGEATEQLHLNWLEREHDEINERGIVRQHPKIDWAACTLDGFMRRYQCPIEVKHNNGFEPVQQVIDRYQPQMHWQMIVTQTKQCGFSVIRGTKEPEFYLIPYDREYAAEIGRRAKDFMEHVRKLTPPVTVDSPAVIPVFEAIRTIDMTENLEWRALASRWLELKPYQQQHYKTDREMKALVPADVKVALGGGVICKRSKAGSLTIRPDNGEDNG